MRKCSNTVVGQKTNRIRRDGETLRRISDDHLHYEIMMFDQTGRLLASGKIANPSIQFWAILESSVIHTRTLLDFFFSKNPQLSDVIAEDFYPTSEAWTRIRDSVSSPQDIEEIKRRVNKEVAHLTYDRLNVRQEDKNWNAQLKFTYDLLAKAFGEFIQSVPEEAIGPKLLKQKRRQ